MDQTIIELLTKDVFQLLICCPIQCASGLFTYLTIKNVACKTIANIYDVLYARKFNISISGVLDVPDDTRKKFIREFESKNKEKFCTWFIHHVAQLSSEEKANIQQKLLREAVYNSISPEEYMLFCQALEKLSIDYFQHLSKNYSELSLSAQHLIINLISCGLIESVRQLPSIPKRNTAPCDGVSVEIVQTTLAGTKLYNIINDSKIQFTDAKKIDRDILLNEITTLLEQKKII